MTYLFGLVTLVALIAAVSILTVASMACATAMSTRLFELVEATVDSDIEGGREKFLMPRHRDPACHRARDLIGSYSERMQYFYFIASVAPALLVVVFSTDLHAVLKDIADVHNISSVEYELTNAQYSILVISISTYLIYIYYIMYRILRIDGGYFLTYKRVPNKY